MMITMFDEDDTGTMGFTEFTKLITMIEHLKWDFERFDTDKNGSLDSSELQKALSESLGITLTKQMLEKLVRRYSTKGEKIWFDDYVALVFKMRKIMGK